MRVDAHHHVWDLAVRAQPWTAGLPALRRSFSMADLAPSLSAHRIDTTVVVQTIAEPAETGELSTTGTCQVAVTLRNDHSTATSEVVQIYLRDPVADIARPAQQLIAAPRVELEPGQTSTLVVHLHADLASYVGRSGVRQVDPDAIQLQVGASSTDIRDYLDVRMTGPRRTVGFDRVAHADVVVTTQ